MIPDRIEWPLSYRAKDGRSIAVRRSAYGDAPALHSGVLEVAQEGVYIGVEPEGVGDVLAVIERVRTYLTTSRTAQLVGELDGQVVGEASMRPGRFGRKDRHWCSLGMWVAPAGRGVGVGGALLESAVKWARTEGFERVVAEVFGSNKRAIALYEKFGFAPEGRQKRKFVLPGIGYVDNVLMALEIEQGGSGAADAQSPL
jgi:RimJ/RimL family protein N-acetyltransferase